MPWMAMALALAAHPEGDNWPVLVKALPILEGGGATFVMKQLSQVDRKPEDPEVIRQLILVGARRSTGIDAIIRSR